jgi:two-component system OmpR family response regulator/two-component system response regulator ChvI
LVVDDDAALVASLRALLSAEGHGVTTANGGRQALELAARLELDAIVCDINMPDLDGFSVCRQLRQRGVTTPIVLLTTRESDIDEALGLELGADDYMTKPFSPRVLLARLGALARRAAPVARPRTVTRGELAIDLDRLAITVAGSAITATLTELRMLAALVEHAGRVLSRERLLALGREDESFVAPRIVDTYVARLRKKLDGAQAGYGAHIETVTGAGYRWRDG